MRQNLSDILRRTQVERVRPAKPALVWRVVFGLAILGISLVFAGCLIMFGNVLAETIACVLGVKP